MHVVKAHMLEQQDRRSENKAYRTIFCEVLKQSCPIKLRRYASAEHNDKQSNQRSAGIATLISNIAAAAAARQENAQGNPRLTEVEMLVVLRDTGRMEQEKATTSGRKISEKGGKTKDEKAQSCVDLQVCFLSSAPFFRKQPYTYACQSYILHPLNFP